MKPLDYLTALVVTGCFVLLQFGNENASKTAALALMAIVGNYFVRKTSDKKD